MTTQVLSLEALYVVEFADIEVPGQYRNGGVAILETGRIYGGDSGYHYIGTFEAHNGEISGTAKITKHNPLWGNAFGDAANEFQISFMGKLNNGNIIGSMMRVDKPGIVLPVRFTRRVELP